MASTPEEWPIDLLDKWLLEDILQMPDEQIREELREIGIDPDKVAAEMRRRVLDAIAKNDARLQATRTRLVHSISWRSDDLLRAAARRVWYDLNPRCEPPECLLVEGG